jgi:16S rRNA (cytosine1402-N4)-methyltransferase
VRCWQPPNCRVLAFDRDPRTVAGFFRRRSAEFGGRLTVVEAPFSEMLEIAPRHGFDQADGVLFDFGVSSMQLDEAARGFSFRFDGPLDMRMSAKRRQRCRCRQRIRRARTLRASSPLLGEEKKAKFVARAIVDARKGKADHERTG